ncbi:MAG: hypothetical protein JNL79_39555 [Myxococcales bacterium]|nr:hypothetical protein [Myxococcales bacterium]
MSDDLLDRATRALREESRVEPRDLEATRARLLADVRRTRRQRSRMIQWVMPIAAVLALGTAYAAATGKLRTWVMANRPAAVSSTAPLASATTPRPPTVVATVASASVEEPAPPPPIVAPSVVASASAPPVVASVAAPPSAAPTIVVAPSPSASDAMSADLAAYRRAHALHFVEKRWDAALDAWNAYLSANPKGTFALEARYNKAICLVKLGRKAEARVALTPFADGLVGGGYRQTEAKSLLDALDTP